ncbi:AAA family ATPase [Poseidonibacter ostreae]|jgi:ATP-dependent DNA helicase PIF1|uniref:AAA family ATPase n=1 Tax=Poseidonibacter ostreae TaxID=2654171 RepID=A0A6L4WV05_9BACT|nr:AAA family ATPase [Poseidonibacter ostreae]KAB7887148.1 AAA family ATPase [Poseidonibacter ostreae]KAB7888654.1 AAA family ATPase [Poseidonibacter ostreae]
MQETALKILKTGQNVFLTGSAGTGKTHILNEFVLYLKSRKIIPTIVAPTGIAASHLNGQTIHSYFSLGIRDSIDESFISNLLDKKYLQTRFKKLKILIIDEISMVSPNIFSSIDKILKAFKQTNKPFGGIQVILSGDFFQLPPISKNIDGKRFAWQSPSWKELDLQTCYLEKKFRQDDNQLIFVLDEIRSGQVSQKSHDILNARLQKDLDIDFTPTKLYTHNMDVDRINNDELRSIDKESQLFKYTSEGAKGNIEKLFKSALVQEELILKKDAVVMFIKNNPEKYYINGTTGVVIDFTKDEQKLPIVKLSNGYVVKVEYEDWSIENDSGKVQAKISQIPLKLAWAITIHKSQGMTLDAAQIDLSKTFEVGQGYVALSRIKNIEGLKLMGFNDNALSVDPLILSIDPRIKQASVKAANKIEAFEENQLNAMQLSYIQKLGGTIDKKEIYKEKVLLSKEPKIEEKIANHIKTKNLVETSSNLEDLAKNAGFTVTTIMNHLSLIKKEDIDFDMSKYMPSLNTINLVNKAIEQIKETNHDEDFSEDGKIRLKAIFTKLDEKITYNDIKMAIL